MTQSMQVYEVETSDTGKAVFSRYRQLEINSGLNEEDNVNALIEDKWDRARANAQRISPDRPDDQVLDFEIKEGRHLYVIHLNALTYDLDKPKAPQQQSLFFASGHPLVQIGADGTCLQGIICEQKTYLHSEKGSRWASFVIDTANIDLSACQESDLAHPAKKFRIPFYYNFRDHLGCPPWINLPPENALHGGAHPPIGSGGTGGGGGGS